MWNFSNILQMSQLVTVTAPKFLYNTFICFITQWFCCSKNIFTRGNVRTYIHTIGLISDYWSHTSHLDWIYYGIYSLSIYFLISKLCFQILQYYLIIVLRVHYNRCNLRHITAQFCDFHAKNLPSIHYCIITMVLKVGYVWQRSVFKKIYIYMK